MGGRLGICSFDIVNQVLVRLWARRWWDVRASGRSPLLLGASWGRGIAKSDRPRSLGATSGIQPSDRRHMRSEAFWRVVGCDGQWLVVCKLSSSIDVRVRSASGGILVWMVPVHDGLNRDCPKRFGRSGFCVLEHEKGIRWMPWHQEAMKDVARCEKPRGAASRR